MATALISSHGHALYGLIKQGLDPLDRHLDHPTSPVLLTKTGPLGTSSIMDNVVMTLQHTAWEFADWWRCVVTPPIHSTVSLRRVVHFLQRPAILRETSVGTSY